MSEHVQALIDKIKSEGISQAEQETEKIRQQARDEAGRIVDEAKKHAQKIVNDARMDNERLKESTHMALKHVARDTLLDLRKEIEALLTRIISSDVHKASGNLDLAGMIQSLVKSYLQKAPDTDEITVFLSEKDLKALKGSALSRLQDEVKKPIELKGTEDIRGGFTISFDKGKSCFDFSDQSLIEYLSRYLNAETAKFLNS